jgi:endonuclease YncB( thermonuclease family)
LGGRPFWLSRAILVNNLLLSKPRRLVAGMAPGNHEWTDGDSFRVRLRDGRLETFRLYFADTTKSRTRGKRSDEQAAYFAREKKQIGSAFLF